MSIQVIDNFLPRHFSDKLENICKTEIPWFFSENISGENHKNVLVENVNISDFQYGFVHIALSKEGKKSEYYEKILPITYFMNEYVNIEQIKRIRLALNTSIKESVQHFPHVDIKGPHKVLLYYVNDSDGDTFVYNEKYENNKDHPLSFTIKEKISPKKNRAVIFDGLHYHSSSKPINNSARFIVNIDFI